MSTRRGRILSILENEQITSEELSSIFGLTVKEVVQELRHISSSIGKRFKVKPAQCNSCGFVFHERLDKAMLKTPTKCPKCRHERIVKPLFWVERKIED